MVGGGGECDNKGRKTWGRETGEGDEGIMELKINVILAAAERKQCLLLGAACLVACSRGWVQHCRMTSPAFSLHQHVKLCAKALIHYQTRSNKLISCYADSYNT